MVIFHSYVKLPEVPKIIQIPGIHLLGSPQFGSNLKANIGSHDLSWARLGLDLVHSPFGLLFPHHQCLRWKWGVPHCQDSWENRGFQSHWVAPNHPFEWEFSIWKPIHVWGIPHDLGNLQMMIHSIFLRNTAFSLATCRRLDWELRMVNHHEKPPLVTGSPQPSWLKITGTYRYRIIRRYVHIPIVIDQVISQLMEVIIMVIQGEAPKR